MNSYEQDKLDTLGLGQPKRFITDHDAQGRSIFSNAFTEEVPSTPKPGAVVHDVFVSTQTPAQMNNGEDLKAMADLPPVEGISRPGATTMRFVDFLPGLPAIMHRTHTIDFGVVISGELELILDSGEKRMLKPGDTVVQRGTNHAWRNPDPRKTTRCLFVMAPCEPLIVNGTQLGESFEHPQN
ncbi:hypothetical protein BKA67DRAFT_575006 [Truncatella angustata]|uniref:Cupin type-2 domain-containing protein n=1 Tax=Truncatella angustata TaxID=152316 RepID=A0A9P8ZV57_9PEZI|nr:uncharacterized protein BKA67DRAFT_575006 [Truncatella angustata]KAH6648504.1 hypothetical protein BKA67DRAFT_575006 [Truncatella angustata]KAH8195256.1 hypothetical protein TruAng_010580 [Truncatella angustata]